jgi:alanyl aminopeptidase
LILVLLLPSAALAGEAAPAAATPAAPAPAAPASLEALSPADAPRLRLPRTVLPESNRVWLVLDPDRATFNGRIEIAAQVAAPVSVFWLNAEQITIDKATLVVGGETWPLDVMPQEHDFVGFRAPRSIPAGAATITISYSGRIDDTETEGIFRQKENGDWYIFTQFEPLAARKAFPCFDEPDSKVPWQITIEVPPALVALANTPVAAEETVGDRKRITFGRTEPLPSYLVAFAVGPFEVVEGGKTRRGVPIRVIVPRGRGGDVGYVVETTTPILALLEDYFGSPYPFAKLDLLAIPLTVGFGAMENPGLVTFSQSLLTARREDFTINYRRRYASTTAHELAHQWFGDLVTLAWWDELWLNEAFASWMGGKVIDQWKPEWDGGVGSVARRSSALRSDQLQTARMVRQPIESNHDVENAFDGITYSKGAAVIRMFESWVGEDRFRDGIRAYLKEHAWSNATATDFLQAIGTAAGRDVAGPFTTFLDRAGAPLVTFETPCSEGATPVLRLAQQRFLPLGSRASAEQSWHLPVCVRYPAGKDLARGCVLLTERTGELPLSRAKTCPAWILPNDGGLGYYRSDLGGDWLERLLDRGMEQLTLPERVAVIGDVDALVTAGKVEAGVALGLVTRYAQDENRQVVSAVASIAEAIADDVPDELRPNYARFIRKVFGARARQMGWVPARDEDDDTRLLRNLLLGLVTDEGEDRELAAAAQPAALAWLEDHAALDPDMIGLVLNTAALYGDRALFDRLHAAAKSATDRRDRRRLLGALASFRDPELARRATALVLGDDFDIRETMGLVYGGLDDPRNRRMVYDFVKQNHDALLQRLPKDSARGLVLVASAQCDASIQADAAAFFEKRMAELPGGPRLYAQSMEQLDLCVKQREAHRRSIAEFLETY